MRLERRLLAGKLWAFRAYVILPYYCTQRQRPGLGSAVGTPQARERVHVAHGVLAKHSRTRFPSLSCSARLEASRDEDLRGHDVLAFARSLHVSGPQFGFGPFEGTVQHCVNPKEANRLEESMWNLRSNSAIVTA